ncbi:MAG: hypothetical protein RL885_18635 [Planctomycetota bacterium]
MSRVTIVVLIASLLAGCGVNQKLHRAAFENAKPRRIAILPFHATGDGEREAERAAYTRRVFHEQLTIQPFAFLSLPFVDARLHQAGLEEQQPIDSWKRADLADLGVDAVLAGEMDGYSATDVGLFSREGLSGRFALLDAEDGRVLWEAEHSFNNFGGLILGSGQVIREIRRFANSSDEIYVRAVEEFVSDVVETFPGDRVEEEWRDQLLAIDDFLVDAERSVLRAGDQIEIRVEGTPDMRVSVHCGDVHRVPLFEVAPGSYRGSHVVVRGEAFEVSEFEAVMSSPFGGVMAQRLEIDWTIRADSQPPELEDVTLNESTRRIAFQVGVPSDAVRYVVESRSGVVAESEQSAFDLPSDLPKGPLYAFVTDAIGNRSRSFPVRIAEEGAES